MTASALVAVVVAGYAGYSSASDSSAATKAKPTTSTGSSAARIAAAKPKTVVPPSPDLQIALSPTSGAPGTIVRIGATGCIDANGLNHQVSYDVSKWRITPGKPNPVRAIGSTLSGTTLTASYTIRRADLRGHGTQGTFWVQCGSTVVSAPFTVSG